MSVGLQQRVEILKALVRGAEILVLDEPTAVLTPAEADQLFEMLRVLKRENKTIIFITHKLREIMTSDRSRLGHAARRDGRDVRDRRRPRRPSSPTRWSGARSSSRSRKAPAHPGAIALEARNLVVRDDRGVARVDDVSFTLREGEILGVAGVAGNGQSELLEALAGIRPLSVGEILIDGAAAARCRSAIRKGMRAARRRPCAGRSPSRRPRHAVRGLRERDARLPSTSRSTAKACCSTARRSSPTQATKMEAFDVRPRAPLLKTANFSGGNQQKIVLAREIERNPK